MYYPDLNDGVAISDYSLLKKVYHCLMTSEAPKKAGWRFFGKTMSCWTKKEILKHCPDTVVVRLLLCGLGSCALTFLVYLAQCSQEKLQSAIAGFNISFFNHMTSNPAAQMIH